MQTFFAYDYYFLIVLDFHIVYSKISLSKTYLSIFAGVLTYLANRVIRYTLLRR